MTLSRPLARPTAGLRLRQIPFAAFQAAQVPGRGGEEKESETVSVHQRFLTEEFGTEQ